MARNIENGFYWYKTTVGWEPVKIEDGLVWFISEETNPISHWRLGERIMTNPCKTQWQPIETAPRNTPILFAGPSTNLCPIDIVNGYVDRDGICRDIDSVPIFHDYLGMNKTIYWMPIDALPPCP